jgi:D-alanine-D-alanine ligase
MLKIGVIVGGTSSEREISLRTGEEMLKHLDQNKYKLIKIDIKTPRELIDKVCENNIDFALLALHGKFGEDGSAQAILESLSIPYSGSNMLSSCLCMNKDIAKKLMKASGVATPDWINIKKHEELNYELIAQLGYPVIVKPVSGGSSIGTFIVRNSEEIVDAVLKAFQYDDELVIEKYIKGAEITCCILNDELLPVISIKPNSEFFDYEAKYNYQGSEETLLNLDDNLYLKIKQLCDSCWRLFRCSVYGRIDIIVKDNTPYVLEVNTLPGMTETSLFPKSAAGANITFQKLLDIIIESSLKLK